MKRMRTSKVLISGLTGLGAEIAKNVILGGVKSCSLHDDKPAELRDLSSQFYISPDCVGTPRAEACIEKLRELNEQVNVDILKGGLTLDDAGVGQYQVVVLVNKPKQELLAISNFCHERNICLIATGSYGLYGYAFSDFGEDFVCVDSNGENPVSGMVVNVDSEGVVTCSDDELHGLSTGNSVTFVGVEGAEELNDGQPREVTVLSGHTFSVEKEGLSPYTRGGYFTEVKTPTVMQFKSLEASLPAPALTMSNLIDFERPAKLHALLQGLWAFQEAHGGALPTPSSPEHAQWVLQAVRTQAEESGEGAAPIDEELMLALARGSAGDLCPMAAFLGGVVGQEVLKASCGKLTPLQQWLHVDFVECLPSEAVTEEEAAPLGSRYDGQVAVFGRAFQEQLQRQTVFLVGSGALGCEFLKNFAAMGLAAGQEGHAWVTDMDHIEISNLSRQFLFRPWDVTKKKSHTAAQAALRMNPALNLTAWEDKVAPDTEHKFNAAFWEGLSLVVNALDNVEARRYVDSRCVEFRKPLLESGTLGSKSNVQPVVPDKTQSYGSTTDAPGKDFPVCTVKYFPTLIEHTLTWGRDLFEGLFSSGPSEVKQYVGKEDYLAQLEKQRNSKLPRLKVLQRLLLEEPARCFEDCVAFARRHFESHLHDNILQLLAVHPLDKVVEGRPFWSEKKKPPSPILFDFSDQLHRQFIIAAANLYAAVWGIPGSSDPAVVATALEAVVLPEFKVDTSKKVAANDEEEKALAKAEAEAMDVDALGAAILEALPAAAELSGLSVTAAEFEKDDDTNYHMAFIGAASNLRARAYKIPEADALTSKQIVGRIIPAIATTTALTTGAVMFELYKVLQGAPLEAFRSSNFNLAVNTYTGFEPAPCEKKKVGGLEFTLWDTVTMEEDMTVQEFVDKLMDDFGLDVMSISTSGADAVLLWAGFMSDEIMEPRLDMLLAEVVEEVKGVPPTGPFLCLSIDADAEEEDEDEDGEEEEDDEDEGSLPVFRIRLHE